MGKAYLVLADGSIYEGVGFGAETPAVGELEFTTGVVGYGETLTDPCHAGQIVLQTFPLIGNYGVIGEDLPDRCAVAGYVVREWCADPSNFRCQCDIDTYLKNQGVPGICGLDTRAITRKLRDQGSMNAMICTSLPADLSALAAHAPANAVSAFSCAEKAAFPVENARFHVAMLDLGARRHIIEELNRLGCSVTLWPQDAAAEAILADQPDGLLLGDGPDACAGRCAAIGEIAKLAGKLPILGLGLGHLLLALACGGSIVKMKAGHHGSNQPAKDLHSGRTYITVQNHGHSVVSAPGGSTRFINVNDQSCEGMVYADLNAFSLQFIPERCVGPNDTAFLYDQFISMMGGDDACR